MNKKYIYISFLVIFIAASGFVVMRYSQKEKAKSQVVYDFLKRPNADANDAEWYKSFKQAEAHQDKLRQSPGDIKSMLALANIFIQEGRVTGNFAYYDKAAMKYVNDVLKQYPTNFEAGLMKSLLYMSQHHFADGLAMAEKVQQANPYNALIYGVMVDGNVEMGNYDSAVSNSDKMISLRPDIRSYSRIAYLREIYGDYPGAIEAMQMAITAGAPGAEATAWCRIQQARLYEFSGMTTEAKDEYEQALEDRPHYAYALAGLGKIALAKGNYAVAEKNYKEALQWMPDNAFKVGLAEVYVAEKKPKEAAALQQEVIASLEKDALSGEQDEDIGHYADRELAYAYLAVGDMGKSLDHAMKEYNRRPENIDVNETVGWVLYKNGDYAKALPYMITALKTGSKNPVLLCQAGLVYVKNQNPIKAREYLTAGLKENVVIPADLRQEARNALQNL
ncbi:MAG: tetratricopeptide repeat protein [Ferruginibacter sp.]